MQTLRRVENSGSKQGKSRKSDRMAAYSYGGSDPCCVRVGEDIVMSTLTDKEKEILLAFAEHNMNCSEAAMSLYMARNSFHYYFKSIEAKTGLNPRKFYDLIKLLETDGKESA